MEQEWMSGSQMWPSCSGQGAQPPPDQMWQHFPLPPPSIFQALRAFLGKIPTLGPTKDSVSLL